MNEKKRIKYCILSFWKCLLDHYLQKKTFLSIFMFSDLMDVSNYQIYIYALALQIRIPIHASHVTNMT